MSTYTRSVPLAYPPPPLDAPWFEALRGWIYVDRLADDHARFRSVDGRSEAIVDLATGQVVAAGLASQRFSVSSRARAELQTRLRNE